MLISTFTGVHGAGKIELFEDVAQAMIDDGFKVRVAEIEGGYPSIQMRAKALGLAIEEATTPETQYYLAIANMESDLRNRRMASQDKVDLLLSVRSVCDVIPYTLYLKENEDKQLILEMLYHHIARYPVDVLFAPDPLPWFERNKQSSQDFQHKIRHLFREVWNKHKLSVTEVPVFAADNLDLNQKDRVRFCTKLLRNRLGERIS